MSNMDFYIWYWTGANLQSTRIHIVSFLQLGQDKWKTWVDCQKLRLEGLEYRYEYSYYHSAVKAAKAKGKSIDNDQSLASLHKKRGGAGGRSMICTVLRATVLVTPCRCRKEAFVLSVSRFQEKEKRGEMITLNDNINDNTHPVQGKIITSVPIPSSWVYCMHTQRSLWY